MKEFGEKANKIRRRVIKAIDEAIADVCKKLFENEMPELQPHDHDPSPRPPISPSESSDDSKSISCGSLQQATTWFGGDEFEGDTIENVTCDSAAETLSEEVMLFALGSLSQACTSPPDSPENSSSHDADNESISPELIRRYSLGGGDYQDSNRSHTALISNSQYAQLSQATLSRDEVR